MPGRSYSSGSGYRYGFNGKEHDKELASGDYDFGARMYDARLGRWWSVDGKAGLAPGETPYGFCSNNPIVFNDPDGEWKERTTTLYYRDGNGNLQIKHWYNVFKKTAHKEVLIQIHDAKLYVHGKATMLVATPDPNSDYDDVNRVPASAAVVAGAAQLLKKEVESTWDGTETSDPRGKKDYTVSVTVEVVGDIKVVDDLSRKNVKNSDDLIIAVDDITTYYPDEDPQTSGLTISKNKMLINKNNLEFDNVSLGRESKPSLTYSHEIAHQVFGDVNHRVIDDSGLRTFPVLDRMSRPNVMPQQLGDPKGGGYHRIKKESKSRPKED